MTPPDLYALVSVELKSRGLSPDVEPHVSDHGSATVFRFSAKHPEVGDLLVWVYSDEVIVGFDSHRSLHDHFDQYSLYPDTPPDLVRPGIAAQAVDFVSDVLNDRIVYEIGARSSATMRADSDDLRRKSDCTYLRWSGPF